MATLKNVLPAPTQPVTDREEDSLRVNQKQLALTASYKTVPGYGHRKGWIPRSVEDFGDGGAFPEIHVAQHPLDMGRKEQSTSNALAIQLDAQSKIKYDVLARQGHGKDKVVYSKFTDLLPSQIMNEDESLLQKPSAEDIAKVTEKTVLALEKLTRSRISAATPVRRTEKKGPAHYIRYVSCQQGFVFNSGAKQRVIHCFVIQEDPMEPSKFRINKKIPRQPPSPPAPVLHSPTRKATIKEQQEWRVPPCISNWKNAKGYTIPLDKRLAADGRGLQQVHINENFAKLAEALNIADRKAREAVEKRAQMEKTLAKKEKECKEENLLMLAQKAREERAGIRSRAIKSEKDEEIKEREQIRFERHKERQRDRNIQRAAPDKRSKLERRRERDISEQIALGVPNARVGGGETQYDQRLFNQSKGMDSGFGDEDSYTVYDKPWRQTQTIGQSIYRPSRNVDKDIYGDDLDKLIKTNRFVPDKKFSGTDRLARREGPVQFERQEEDDPFGLDKFLTEAKKASKRPAESDRDRSRDHDRNRKQCRKD